ncbi:F-type H+-transporting ATPase subunit delta [Lampropedia hyalina DSM 16112]|jgi:F-type H+-transporting ATPase subunit delta|uniref:ATP synthase subunit delta n=1 Tax=Lampropedia hyalina DSM 16112 TaxID=1122156 RepID=A0A1M5EZG5_9BURK|nr:F0F1 ATP synthase subunit delta [Lampropedia hyalina]SHF84720.1 F-type H+-transporting ATPase subunit delta [Lampropedia hyalina DSM 16112]
MAELATIARPYAEALFKAGAADAWQISQWLNAVATVAANADVQRVARSPRVTQTQVLDLFKGAVGDGLSALAENFLRTVLENDRLQALPEIAAQFRSLLNAQRGAADAVLYSAFPLDQDALAELRVVLEKRFARSLNLTVEVDESLIGGVRVVVGDEELDTSVKARLEQMKAALVA